MKKYKFLSDQHIHTLDGEPLYGTTTVLGIVSKELTYWASGMALREFGWLNPKQHTEEELLASATKALNMLSNYFIDNADGHNNKEYVKFLNKCYRAHDTFKNKRASEGTDLHALIENWIKSQISGVPQLFESDQILSFKEWANKNVKRFLFSEVHCYSENLWVGGVVDFAYEDMAGNNVLADIKSSKDVYFSHFLQVGGYDIQLSENGGLDSDGNKIWDYKPFARHEVFALGKPGWNKPEVCTNPEGMKNAFKNALELYKVKQAFEDHKSGK